MTRDRLPLVLAVVSFAIQVHLSALSARQEDSDKNEAMFREMLVELKQNEQAAALLKQLEGEWICSVGFRDGEELTSKVINISFVPDLFVVKDGVWQYYYPPEATGYIPPELRAEFQRPSIAVAWHNDLNAIEFRRTAFFRSEVNGEWTRRISRRLVSIKDGQLTVVSALNHGELPKSMNPEKGNNVIFCRPSDRVFFDFDHLDFEYDLNAQEILGGLEGEWTFSFPETEAPGPLFPPKGVLHIDEGKIIWTPDPNIRFQQPSYMGVPRDRFDMTIPWQTVAVDVENKKVYFTVPAKDHVYWFVLFEPPDIPKEWTGQTRWLKQLGTHPKSDPRDLRVIEPGNISSFKLRQEKNTDER